MGLLADLGYEYPASVGRLRRLAQAFVSSRPGAWLAQRQLHRVDRWVFGLTAQRATFSSLVSGLPVLMVTTTGARSGTDRTVPLLGIPVGENLALVGSNFGQRPTPGWVHNLVAHPAAMVTYRTRSRSVRARPADDDTAGRVLEEGSRLYAGYAKYPSRAPHRVIRVFVLESA